MLAHIALFSSLFSNGLMMPGLDITFYVSLLLSLLKISNPCAAACVFVSASRQVPATQIYGYSLIVLDRWSQQTIV